MRDVKCEIRIVVPNVIRIIMGSKEEGFEMTFHCLRTIGKREERGEKYRHVDVTDIPRNESCLRR